MKAPAGAAKKSARKAVKKATAKATTPKVSPGKRRVPAQEVARTPSWAQSETLTTAQAVPVDDTDNALRAGACGPSLLEDFHFREKITHFDHERIPARVVHACGAGAHDSFEWR